MPVLERGGEGAGLYKGGHASEQIRNMEGGNGAPIMQNGMRRVRKPGAGANPQADYLGYMQQQGVIPPGAYPMPTYAGPGYGAPNPGLGTGGPAIGRTQLTPNVPSPGLGYGAPMPMQNEDGSFGNAGQDPLLILLAAYLNKRFPNGG